jgi:hypothetical protein
MGQAKVALLDTLIMSRVSPCARQLALAMRRRTAAEKLGRPAAASQLVRKKPRPALEDMARYSVVR